MTTTAPNRLVNIDALKAEIFDGVTISTVAEHLEIELQASGEQWRGLCPLHEERTPSFYVHDGKRQYHCFGCKAGGDLIDLVERVRHLGFIEALYWLAAEADVDISVYERPMTEVEQREDMLRRFCEGVLQSRCYSAHPGTPQIGGPRYPKRLDVDTAAQFGVGVSPGLGDAPPPEVNYLDGKLYLFNGVLLPWRTPSGRLLGWRVREHEGQDKSVVGTPNDFPLGKITDTLFGIQVAREHITAGRLVAVEGEYDVMALHASERRDVVAMGGSSFTDAQMKLVESLHVRELVAVFDGDTGGYAAAKACAEKYWAHPNVFVRVAVCDDGLDPEDTVKQQGVFYWDSIVMGARAALEFLLRLEWAARPRNTLTEKLEFVKWIRETYGQKLRTTDESLVLAEVSRWLGIPELEVRDYVRSADGALCAIDSERVLIGRACRDKQFYLHLRSRLGRDDFFVLKHQRAYEMLADMLLDDLEFDLITISQRASGYGIPVDYLAGCAELSDANSEYHIGVVADLALRRTTRDDAVAFRDRIADLTQPAELLVGDLTHRITTKALHKAGSTQRTLLEQVDQAMETLHDRMRNPNEIHGIDLGMQYPRLSRILQGLQPKRLVLVSAISRQGKSTMLAQWAASIGVHQSIPVDLVSLEMDETELLYKITSHMTGIDSLKISGGRLEEHEAKTVEYAMLRIRNSPLTIWTPDGLTGTEFLLYARESVMQRRTRVFMLDYVQLIDPEPGQERDNGYKLYGDFGRLCKMKVARSMDVSVVCAAQLNRGAADKEHPTSEDMGDSYALVRHSDVILILHGKPDSSTLECWVDKNRQGAGDGLVPMQYLKPAQTFFEASASREPEYMVKT